MVHCHSANEKQSFVLLVGLKRNRPNGKDAKEVGFFFFFPFPSNEQFDCLVYTILSFTHLNLRLLIVYFLKYNSQCEDLLLQT